MLKALSAVDEQPIVADGFVLREQPYGVIVSIATSTPPNDWPNVGQTAGPLVRLGPDQCLWLSEAEPEQSDHAVNSEQTDAWTVMDFSGPRTDAILERLCCLDVANWPEGSASRTILEHVSAIIIKRHSDHYQLLVPRSLARCFWQSISRFQDAD